MKLASVLLSLPLLALSAPAQFDSDAEAAVDPNLKAEELAACHPKEVLRPVMRKDAKRRYFSFGPIELKANPNGAAEAGHSHGGMGMGMGMGGETDNQGSGMTITGTQFCAKGKESCTVLAGQISISDAAGKIVNVTNGGIYTHHILTTSISKTEPFVNSLMARAGQGFVGAGDDNGNTPFIYTPRDGKFDSGFVIAPTDKYSAQIVLVNYNTKPVSVCVNYDLEYMEGEFGIPVKSSLLAAGLIINTSKLGARNTTGKPMAFIDDGSIILAKGHMHDGGSAMYLALYPAGAITKNTKPIYTCASRAQYGGKIKGGTTETITNVSDCNKDTINVKKGEQMIMTAEYDLKTHSLRETSGGGMGGVMGMFRIIFVPRDVKQATRSQ